MLTTFRKRLLFCSSVAPQRTGAGELLVYRHLTSLKRWDIVTVAPENRPAEGAFRQKLVIATSDTPRWLRRARRGLLWSAADKALARLTVTNFASAADSFRPDAVVSVMVPDILLTAAALYAQERGIPLVLFCHDDYERIMPWAARSYFGKIYCQAAMRLCVSETMAGEYVRRYGVLGVVLPPIPGKPLSETRAQRDGETLTIGYAGSLGRGYEQVMVSLADALHERGGRLVIASRTLRTVAAAVWRHAAVTDLGMLDPERVESSLLQAGVNALLAVQSFDPADRLIQYNFPSKLTEYMMFGLPILIAAPEYASVARWLTKEPSAATLVPRPDADAFSEVLTRLGQASERWALAKATAEVAQRYTPDRLSNLFEDSLLEAIGSKAPA